jgi:anaerobic magnesium-protoporphyrin IX monomethyl ester cyclase
MAAPRQAGYTTEMITYQSDPGPILEHVKRRQPVLIGFALIFQYMAPDFAKVISALHQGGLTAHITMGGHYPGFDHAEVLERMPHLDSIVRFEGEATLVELLDRLDAGDDWHGVTGIAYQICRYTNDRTCSISTPPLQK